MWNCKIKCLHVREQVKVVVKIPLPTWESLASMKKNPGGRKSDSQKSIFEDWNKTLGFLYIILKQSKLEKFSLASKKIEKKQLLVVYLYGY